MKKMIGLFLGILLLPMVTLAEELPKEGVHYFLEYPNGEEQVTANYEEAANPQEKLIYTGVTDSNGNVTLNGWNQSGQLRIVQKVPNGYSTDTRELTVNLSEKQARFVDYKGVLNPKTGQSLMVILLVVGSILGISIITVKKNKKTLFLLIIPILTLGFNKVKADGEDFIIKVHDKEGNPLSNVEVEVYAKPNKVEASPAVIFNANGGNFLDGTEKMYFRLPNNNCTLDEFDASLSNEDYEYLIGNIQLAYRENYIQTDMDFFETLTDGTEIKLNWRRESSAKIITYEGNGGSFKIGNKEFTSLKFNALNAYILNHYSFFKKEGEYNIGFDDNASCSNFDKNGISNVVYHIGGRKAIFKEVSESSQMPSTIYACYHGKPDGIYVNGELFLGNIDTCFEKSRDYGGYELFSLYNANEKGFIIDDSSNDNITFSFIDYANNNIRMPLKNLLERKASFDNDQIMEKVGDTAKEYSTETIQTIEVIENGNTIISVEASDLIKEDNYYLISNETKYNQFKNYISSYITNCVQR